MVMIPNAPRMGDMPKGDPVPEGVYYLRSDKVEYKVSGKDSKNPGTPMASVMFTVFGPEAQEEYHGRKIFDNFMLAGEGMFRTRLFLEKTGHEDDFVLEETDQLANLEVAAVVQIEAESKDPKTGKTYPAKNVIKKFLSIEEGEEEAVA